MVLIWSPNLSCTVYMCTCVTSTPVFLYRSPSKRFVILGTNFVMSKMRVMDVTMKGDNREKYESLMKEINIIVNHMFLLARDNWKNYIIDQVSLVILSWDWCILS